MLLLIPVTFKSSNYKLNNIRLVGIRKKEMVLGIFLREHLVVVHATYIVNGNNYRV